MFRSIKSKPTKEPVCQAFELNYFWPKNNIKTSFTMVGCLGKVGNCNSTHLYRVIRDWDVYQFLEIWKQRRHGTWDKHSNFLETQGISYLTIFL